MSAPPPGPAVALSFFDPEREIHGTARGGLTLLFEGRRAQPQEEPAAIERAGAGWRAHAGEALDVTCTPTADAADLGGVTVALCAVEGRAGGTKISGLGTIAETHRPPEWGELEALRAISAVFEPGTGLLAVARRPRTASGHGEELVTAALVEGGVLRSPDDARISTVYDGGGRQHSAGLELWFPGEDYPRRLFGTVQAGTTLELEGLVVHAAAFNWRMEGHTGAGLYELTLRRDDEPAAA